MKNRIRSKKQGRKVRKKGGIEKAERVHRGCIRGACVMNRRCIKDTCMVRRGCIEDA